MTKYGFGIHEGLPHRLRPITPDLIENIYDAVVNYGRDVVGISVRRIGVELPDGRRAYFTAVVPAVPEHKRNITVSPSPGMVDFSSCDIVIIDRQGSFLAVHRSFSLADLKSALREIDDGMSEAGAYDRETGLRRRVNHDTREKAVRLSVDREFRQPNQIIGLAVCGRNDDDVRDLFDRPSDVFVLENKNGVALVVTVKCREMVERAISAAMLDFGIVDVSELNGCDPALVKRFQDSVAAHLDSIKKADN
jgi:hypothetical protein